MYCSILPSVVSVISTLNTAADKEKAVHRSQFTILLSNENMCLLFVVSPSAIPDLSLVYAIFSRPLARELKGTNDSCLTDGSAPCVCEGMCFREDARGVEDLTPHSCIVPKKMEDYRQHVTEG